MIEKLNVRVWIVIVVTLALGLVIGMTGGASQIVNAIITGGMWSLLAVGLALILGVMNIPHFAHGESFMAGAYVAYFLFTPLSEYLQSNPNQFLSTIAPFAGFLGAAVAGFLLGILIEKLIFYQLRRRTKSRWVMNAFLVTVGISFILTYGTTLVLGPNFRGIPRSWEVKSVNIGSVYLSIDRVVAFAIAIVSLSGLWYFLHRTRTGRAIRAVSQDEAGAQMVGININFIHTLTFALATAMSVYVSSLSHSRFEAIILCLVRGDAGWPWKCFRSHYRRVHCRISPDRDPAIFRYCMGRGYSDTCDDVGVTRSSFRYLRQ
jgi:branched-chain amino acid transport system permease protein